MAETEPPACRLYLVLPSGLAAGDAPEAVAGQLATALEAGEVACVLLRTGRLDDRAALRAARALGPVAQARDVAFLVEDRPEIARESGADGVHLSGGEAAVARLRETIGPEAIVGVSCGVSRHAAMLAGEAGADYVAFEGEEAELKDLLDWWQGLMTLPCVALGGVTLENAAALARAGADFLALEEAVWEHPDGPGAAVEAFAARLAEADR
ncbi:MAG: thiamine phosphate synthase [Rhodospirillales bacterium]|nr:thiamine phosphate synthase [Rhodospirillales bacterium]MDH3914157.1 thiamine phosphate synthase [Rhodospirillales bacterium]MDH3918285.1 thiamine phosphate synthase [Rhodospirillales bacterium]MDH3968154.1 thiamine phosphate synthase [Rhodospirillales bacterium]